MPLLPESDIYLVVRTFFGDDSGWSAIREEISRGSDEGFFATVELVDDARFDGYSVDALVAAHPHRESGSDVMYVADQQAITTEGKPLLVVRVGSTEDLPFRCRADVLYEVDANLSLSNLDWDDFRDSLYESGVYGELASSDEEVDRTEAEPRDQQSHPHLHFVDEQRRRSDEVPDDWQPEPRLPRRVAARRAFVHPSAWVVVLLGTGAAPGRVRIAGPFGDYREAVLFEKAIQDAENFDQTDVVQMESRSTNRSSGHRTLTPSAPKISLGEPDAGG